MKKLLKTSLILIFLSAPTLGFSKKKEVQVKVENTDSIALDLAIKMKDYDAAIVFSYKLLAPDPQNTQKLYNLAKLYYAAKKTDLSINTCSEIIKIDSMHKAAYELAAIGFKQKKQPQNAIGIYLLLNERFNDRKYLYEVAVTQFENNLTEDCIKTLKAITSDVASDSLSIPMSRTNVNGTVIKEEIKLSAAAFNIAGYIMLKQNNFKEAKIFFSEALKKEPSFVLAENNLKETLKLEEESLKPATK